MNSELFIRELKKMLARGLNTIEIHYSLSCIKNPCSLIHDEWITDAQDYLK